MRVDLITRSSVDAQDAGFVAGPRRWVQITGDDEITDPMMLIRQAKKTIRTGKAIGQRPERTALRVIGLICAATVRARTIGRWSVQGSYDPRTDFRQIALAVAALRVGRGANDPVSLLRAAVAQTIDQLGTAE